MKFFKAAILVFTILTTRQTVGAQNSGYGCLVNNVVYTSYLGEASPYHPSNPTTKFYSSSGPGININFNNYNSNNENNYGYECGKINVFGASSTGSAQQEYVNQNTSCVTSASLGGSISGNGAYVYYSYNNPAYCGGTPPMSLPLDDYSWLILVLTGALGATIIVKKRILI